MIEKHIVNIGYPRTGTTWLWKCLNIKCGEKENSILMDNLDFTQYIEYYKAYKISANFQTNLWQVDREILSFVQKYATHITLIVRNPYDFIERYFDWIYHDQNVKELTDHLVYSGYIKYKDIVCRWSNGALKFKLFFYEDLACNPQKFFEDYMNFCELSVVRDAEINYYTKINANPKQQKVRLNFTKQQIDFINNEINRFQSWVDRDLTHWKK